ncbi:jg2068 [Pararge aegeria aegeria]|uniref:Jg2068 protein n=1 Tax=Pararge aegeria aegeria TaxID=348720 RepID=A0A8S4S411_9NEOP|nr:jg2068 [Pararge aegeria aegeria]
MLSENFTGKLVLQHFMAGLVRCLVLQYPNNCSLRHASPGAPLQTAHCARGCPSHAALIHGRQAACGGRAAWRGCSPAPERAQFQPAESARRGRALSVLSQCRLSRRVTPGNGVIAARAKTLIAAIRRRARSRDTSARRPLRDFPHFAQMSKYGATLPAAVAPPSRLSRLSRRSRPRRADTGQVDIITGHFDTLRPGRGGGGPLQRRRVRGAQNQYRSFDVSCTCASRPATRPTLSASSLYG